MRPSHNCVMSVSITCEAITTTQPVPWVCPSLPKVSSHLIIYCVWLEHLGSTLSKFHVYNTLLTTVTMLYIRSSELIHIPVSGLYHLISISQVPPTLSPWKSPPTTTILLSVSSRKRDEICGYQWCGVGGGGVGGRWSKSTNLQL